MMVDDDAEPLLDVTAMRIVKNMLQALAVSMAEVIQGAAFQWRK